MVTGDSGDLGAAIGAALARAGCDLAVGYVEIARARIGSRARWRSSAAAPA
jgi:NAD(P)-dependent dehydrogenase (short-subunit alcohol dehydrogenase family)